MTSLAVPAIPAPPDGNAFGSCSRTGQKATGLVEEIHLIVVSHASRLGLAIGIVHHEPAGIDDRKARVLYVERVQHQFRYRLREWLLSHLLDHCTKHIYRDRVTPSGARLVAERYGGNPPDDLIKVNIGAIKSVRNPEPMVRAVCLVPGTHR